MSTYRARITGDWLPMPEELLRALRWLEGDDIVLEMSGDALVLHKAPEPHNVERIPPAKKKRIS